MTIDQAKLILLRYRPGVTEADDPELSAALALCESDAALRSWFEAQSKVQAAIRSALREIAPPPGLFEQIVSEHQAALRAAWWRRPQLLATAAVVMLLAAGVLVWSQWPGLRPDEFSVAAFRTRMAKEALRVYQMEMVSNDLDQVRRYLTLRGYPGDFTLPAHLQAAKVTGCLRTRWQSHDVAMICFRRDPAAPEGAASDLWLFVMDEATLKGISPEVKLARASRLMTATWAEGGRIYLLGTEGDEAELKKWL